MKKILLIIIATAFTAITAKATAQEEIREDFKKYFDSFDVDGTFVLYNQQGESYIFYNKELASKGFIPASTFKIYNSLIGLETGVISSEHHVFPWDGLVRSREELNKDLDLESAYKVSAVWYYQELARQVGQMQMEHYINELNYGNKDISAGVDVFWLKGNLRISPMQQVGLLAKLQNYQLPFSVRSIDIIKKVMVRKATDSYILRAKTGWGVQDGKDVGWYVGYIEKTDNVYYFAIYITPKSIADVNFLTARIQITDSILTNLGILEE